MRWWRRTARVWQRLWPRPVPRLSGEVEVLLGDRTTFQRLTYRNAAGIHETGLRALARLLEHGPLPLAALGWLLRFPYLGGALHRAARL